MESRQLVWHYNGYLKKYLHFSSLGNITEWKPSDLLDFDTPNGLRFHISSLSSPNFASSYTLGSIGLVDGSLSYLYSSLPFKSLVSGSGALDLRQLVPGYRLLQDLRQPDQPEWWEIWHQGKRIDQRGELHTAVIYRTRNDDTEKLNRYPPVWPPFPPSLDS